MANVIQKVKLKIGGKTIVLSLDELRELKAALRELFPDPQPAVTIIDRRNPWHAYRWSGLTAQKAAAYENLAS